MTARLIESRFLHLNVTNVNEIKRIAKYLPACVKGAPFGPRWRPSLNSAHSFMTTEMDRASPRQTPFFEQPPHFERSLSARSIDCPLATKQTTLSLIIK